MRPGDDQEFDPDGPGSGEGLFGLGSDPSKAAVQVIPVPWEATASYGRGSSGAPEAVLAASQQVELEDLDFGSVWRSGIALHPVEPAVADWAAAAEGPAMRVIASGGNRAEDAANVDAWSERVHAMVAERARSVLAAGAIPVVLGGDHSSPLGLIRAVAESFPGVGVLQVDAHADLRQAYLGFRWSHASIMHNVLALRGIGGLVGVGWRDLGAAELERIHLDPRIQGFTDPEIGARLAEGHHWARICEEIIDALPAQVYISMDIDGLDPALCPSTGTPVPGGLSFRDLSVLLVRLARRRRVVGFDLCEVCPSQGPQKRDGWDAIVGARVLYKLAGCALRSREWGGNSGHSG